MNYLVVTKNLLLQCRDGVEARDKLLEAITEEVEAKISQGYIPIGSINISIDIMGMLSSYRHPYFTCSAYQTMVKKDVMVYQ